MSTTMRTLCSFIGVTIAALLAYCFSLEIRSDSVFGKVRTSLRQSVSREEEKMNLDVLIIGGGPAGLLTALTLMNRNIYFPVSSRKYRVHVIETLEDPRFTPLGPRSYPLGLGLRGQYVLQSFEQGEKPRWNGLWSQVQSIGIPTDRLFLHFGRWKLPVRQPTDPSVPLSMPFISFNTTKSLLIQRNRLCAVLYSYLLENYQSDFESKRLEISFQKKINSIDFTNHIVTLESGESLHYDLLVGCDGVNSIVRKSLQSHLQHRETPQLFRSEEFLLPWQFKVMSQPIPSHLEADAIHAFPDMSRFFSRRSSSSSFSLFSIPTVNQDLATVVNWKRDNPPSFLSIFNNSEPSIALKGEITEIFSSQYPSFGQPSDEAIQQLLTQLPSNIRKVRCNRYHYVSGKVCLLGDAAHATDATWGQGLSATFLDVEALDQCLTVAQDQLEIALPLYSERQVKEGLALWQLIALPPKGVVGLIFSVYQFALGMIRRLPVIGQAAPLPIQYEISKTLRPYSEIVSKNRFWTDIATKGQVFMEYISDDPLISEE